MGIKSICLVLVLFYMNSCSKEQGEFKDLSKEVVISEQEEMVLDRVNEYRLSIGKNKLEFCGVAYKYALNHNTYMISKGYINHDNFDIRSSNLSLKVNARKVGEILGKDFISADNIVQAWLASPEHKKVLEGNNYTHTAVSVLADSKGIIYYTQLFYY